MLALPHPVRATKSHRELEEDFEMQRYMLGIAAVAAALLLSRTPAMAGTFGSTDAGDGTRSGAMENTDPGTMNPTDQAPAMVIPGSATPGTEMKAGEIEATGKPADETDAIDTTNDIQIEGDAEANADLGDDSSIRSLLEQKNLQEAMDPKNARFKSNANADKDL
jgi:hypothetical protein